MIGLGIPEYEAKRYETALKAGGILISVHVDDSTWAKKAEEILKTCGGTDIARESEERSSSMKTAKTSKDSVNPRTTNL